MRFLHHFKIWLLLNAEYCLRVFGLNSCEKLEVGFIDLQTSAVIISILNKQDLVKDIDDYMNEKKTVQLNCKNIKR